MHDVELARTAYKRANLRWQGAVHECITPSGRIEYADISVRHMPGIKPTSWRNLMIYEGMRSRGETFSARDAYYYARELYYHALYTEAAYRFEKFISRGDGWIEDIYAACKLLGQCKANLGDSKGELKSYLRALEYGAPRADILLCNRAMVYVAYTLARRRNLAESSAQLQAARTIRLCKRIRKRVSTVHMAMRMPRQAGRFSRCKGI